MTAPGRIFARDERLMTVVVAEKPSVGRDVAHVLGAMRRGGWHAFRQRLCHDLGHRPRLPAVCQGKIARPRFSNGIVACASRALRFA